MNITKETYCGNGFIDNIGYTVTDSDGTILFIPALNRTKIYDEHFNSKIIDSGSALREESEKCLDNVFVAGAKTLEDAIAFIKNCKSEFQSGRPTCCDLSNV